jgi:hypothetical protein
VKGVRLVVLIRVMHRNTPRSARGSPPDTGGQFRTPDLVRRRVSLILRLVCRDAGRPKRTHNTIICLRFFRA